MNGLRRLARVRYFGPTLVALVLAMASLPIVALLNPVLVPGATIEPSAPAYSPPTDPARWLSALGSVVAAALVAGTLFGASTVRRPIVAVLALGVAWVVGIVMIPVVPALLDVPFRAVPMCLDSCGHAIGGELEAGLVAFAVGGFVVGFAVAWPQFLVLTLGIFLWVRVITSAAGSKRPAPPVRQDRA